jgi:hypothetical protein
MCNLLVSNLIPASFLDPPQTNVSKTASEGKIAWHRIFLWRITGYEIQIHVAYDVLDARRRCMWWPQNHRLTHSK